MQKEKLLVLIDGNSLLNRAFYAMPLLTGGNGEFTNGVFGFTKMLMKIITEIKPEYICVAFDLRAPTFRHKLYAEYKAQRKKMPEELAGQLPTLKNLLKSMGVFTAEKEGFEADDIIGIISKNNKTNKVIYTGDRDAFQLVDENTQVYFTKKGITEIDSVNIDNFYEKQQITPAQVTDFKALMGDSSDNIPGVAGIGEKTAYSLLKAYKNIDDIYENIDNIQSPVKEKLINGKESAYLSKNLATINTSADLSFDLKEMSYPFPLSNQTKQLFRELRFDSLLKKDEYFEKEQKTAGDEGGDAVIITISGTNELESLLKNIKTISIADDNLYLPDKEKDKEYNIKIQEGFFSEGLTEGQLYGALKGVFENESVKKILYNKKKTLHKLREYGVGLTNAEDVSIMKYLADFPVSESLTDSINFYNLNVKTPACSLHGMYCVLSEKLTAQDMLSLYKDVELKLVDILFEMEVSGFKIDLNALKTLSGSYIDRLNALSEEIYALLGAKINLNSTRQLQEQLFEKLNLKSGKKIKTGYSTDINVLEDLADEHPVVPLIISYRKIQKLMSAYAEGMMSAADRKTGFIHTDFRQTQVLTGRLSSKEPNLQTIPAKETEAREIRRLFIPSDENHILAAADYSQIELRLLAAFSGDKRLCEAFNNGEDIHAITASQVFNVPLKEVSSAQRGRAKAVNFGIIYGISDFGLAKDLRISVGEARDYIKKYFELYKSVKEYMDENVRFAKENGYISTFLKRRRYIIELKSSNYNIRSFGERAAMNMPLQGGSADIIKLAMINVYERLKKEDLQSKLILQVHDELIVDTLIPEKARVAEILQYEMENCVKLAVPLVANVKFGSNLAEIK